MTAARKFRAVLALLAILSATFGAVLSVQLGAAAASAAQPAWRLVSSPDQPHAQADILNGVSCSAAADCMAVGWYGIGSLSADSGLLLERWNGSRWSRLPAPSIGEPPALEQVSCSSKSFCIAVGYLIAGSDDLPLATIWNGHAWSQLDFPVAAGVVEGQLTGVDCFSGTDCVAVGWTYDGAVDTPVLARFNGVTWTMGTTRDGSAIYDSKLVGISCATRTWCVAVGDGVIRASGHDTGIALTSVNQRTWTYSNALKLPAAYSGFDGVSCTGKKTCVAFGFGEPVLDKSFQWVMETGNGSTWRESVTVAPDKLLPIVLPAAIACRSGQQCVIVGELAYGVTATSKVTSLIWAWNGRKLTKLPSLAVRGFRDSDLAGVTCTTGSCWAVGQIATGTISRSLVERS